jgi:hypothetical protein
VERQRDGEDTLEPVELQARGWFLVRRARWRQGVGALVSVVAAWLRVERTRLELGKSKRRRCGGLRFHESSFSGG